MVRVTRVRKAGIDLPRAWWASRVAEVEAPRQLPGLALAGVLVTPGGMTLWGRVVG